MDTIFGDLFILTIPVLEKIIRPIIVYFFLIIGLRLAGKRELGQLNPFDLIVLLTISNTVQNGIIQYKNLDKESIDINELETAAQKQGINSLEIVETVKIDPEVTIIFLPKDTHIYTERHEQLMEKLNHLEREILQLKQKFPG
jgi:uncharacterized membrane protein YcaP (DUF421 family)